MTLTSEILLALLHGKELPLGHAAMTCLSRLKERGYISIHGPKGDRTFKLTNDGEFEALLCEAMEALSAFRDEHRAFIATHDLSEVPAHLKLRMGELVGTMIYNSPASPLSATENFLAMMEKSTWLRGVSGHIMPGYTDVVGEITKRGAEVELVLSYVVIEDLPAGWLDEMLSHPNVHLYEIETARVGLCCMDSGLSLGFPICDRYDIASDLICGPEALLWGQELFEWYKRQAREIKKDG
jgi:predicted transcriptional regulator